MMNPFQQFMQQSALGLEALQNRLANRIMQAPTGESAKQWAAHLDQRAQEKLAQMKNNPLNRWGKLR